MGSICQLLEVFSAIARQMKVRTASIDQACPWSIKCSLPSRFFLSMHIDVFKTLAVYWSSNNTQPSEGIEPFCGSCDPGTSNPMVRYLQGARCYLQQCVPSWWSLGYPSGYSAMTSGVENVLRMC